MSRDELRGSYTLGVCSGHGDYDQGAYGVGGTIGCWAIAAKKATYSREEKDGEYLSRGYDFEVIKDADGWSVEYDFDIDGDLVERHEELFGKGATGTIIHLQNLDRIRTPKASLLRQQLVKPFGVTYYRFISGRSLKLTVGGTEVEPTDPLCWDDPKTIGKVYDLTYDIQQPDGSVKTVSFTVRTADLTYVDEDKIPNGILQGQGGYWWRNERLIRGAVTNGDGMDNLWKRGGNSRRARFGVDYTGDLDIPMGQDNKKSSINPEEALANIISKVVSPDHKQAVLNSKREADRKRKQSRAATLKKATRAINKKLAQPRSKVKSASPPKKGKNGSVTRSQPARISTNRREWVIEEKHLGEGAPCTTILYSHQVSGGKIIDVMEVNLDAQFTKRAYIDQNDHGRNVWIVTEWCMHAAIAEQGETWTYEETGYAIKNLIRDLETKKHQLAPSLD
jgi:hypothetical protein